MPIRVVRFRSRNPLVGVALLVLVLAVLAVLLTLGLALAAGLAAVAGAAVLARRALGRRAPPVAPPALRQGQEVFAPPRDTPPRPLPPGSP
jgi:hypothetical protein